jgi:hypothetical protein
VITLKKILVCFLFLLTFQPAFAQDTLFISPQGQLLRDYYLSLDVEHLWLSGQKVDWETGKPDRLAEKPGKTHCSAFVAAACNRMNIFILRPPFHKQNLLANAQFEWLGSTEGADTGWVRVTGKNIYEIWTKAQQLANAGTPVVATCENPNASEPGHIAMIMPSVVSMDTLRATGPRVIQAGAINRSDAPLQIGFSRHIDQWPEETIWFYYYKYFEFYEEPAEVDRE